MHAFLNRRRLLALVMASAAILAAGVATSAFAGSGQHWMHRPGPGGASITSQPWGTAPDGTPVSLYTLTNGRGMTVTITNFGGIVQSIDVPDRNGQVANVALGFQNLAGYVTDDYTTTASGETFFGGIIGRYANRIANGQFTLNGTTYYLEQNNGTNTLHGGGPDAQWNTKVWTATPISGRQSVSLQLTYTDPAGTSTRTPPVTGSHTGNGFPGTVKATVVYTLTQDDALRIDYTATTTAPTVINLTNHTYFNLAGEASGDVYNQELMINADSYTPINANLIPTGVIAPVAGTPFDFRTPKPIGQDINNADPSMVYAHGYDQNWVLNRSGAGLSLAATAYDPVSGRVLTTYTTEPGVQLYSGNFLVGDLVGTSGHTYRQSDGFTLETQHYPDSPNEPSFPTTVLNPGTLYNSTTIYQFSTANRFPTAP
jgi:aldose 1-epimerase